MPQEIERELMKCEATLYTMQKQYPGIARKAAESRIIYDLAKSNAIVEIDHRDLAEGQKPPTVPVANAMATQMIQEQMEQARRDEADLDIAVKHIKSLEAILSSVQTRSKLVLAEMSLT